MQLPVITLAGAYSPLVPELILQQLPADFTTRSVTTQEELDSLCDIEYLVLRTLKFGAENIAGNPHLKMIHRWGVGYDTVDIRAASAAGVPVAVTSGANSEAVAELAILLVLSLYRHLIQLHNNTVEGIWDRKTYTSTSFLIKRKAVGLVGFGNIGRLVAEKLVAFDATVRYYDVARLTDAQEAELDISYLPLDELIASSDIISLHLPLTEATRNIINGERIRRMKPSTIIVNTSRGGLVNEEDIVAALNEGRLAGYATDCYAEEPYNPNGPLCTARNVVMTPHVGGSVDDLVEDMCAIVAENINLVFTGAQIPPKFRVNAT